MILGLGPYKVVKCLLPIILNGSSTHFHLLKKKRPDNTLSLLTRNVHQLLNKAAPKRRSRVATGIHCQHLGAIVAKDMGLGKTLYVHKC